nr:mucin-2-like [Misgurnus anguillicaudatus]
MILKRIFPALLISWEFVLFTLAHLNKENAEIESLKANQYRVDDTGLYVRIPDARNESPNRISKTLTRQSEPDDNFLTESSFKRHACLTGHSLDNTFRNDDFNQTTLKSPKQDDFEELLDGSKSVTWKHLKTYQRSWDGFSVSEVYQPMFHCGKDVLSIKFAMTRHSDPHLMIQKVAGSHTHKQCRCMKRSHGSSLFLRILFKECYVHNWIRGEKKYFSSRVLYFDRLLLRNLSGIATCHANILPHNMPSTEASPEVVCGKSYMIVKWPSKMIINAKVFGVPMPESCPVLWKNQHSVFVKMKHSSTEGCIVQLDYLDMTGEERNITVSCVQHKVRFERSVRTQKRDSFDFTTAPSIVTTTEFKVPPGLKMGEDLYFRSDLNLDNSDMWDVYVIPTVSPHPLDEILTTNTLASTSKQPDLITEFVSSTGEADVDVWPGFDEYYLWDLIPTVPSKVLKETTHETFTASSRPFQSNAATWASTTKSIVDTSRVTGAKDEYDFGVRFSVVPRVSWKPEAVTSVQDMTPTKAPAITETMSSPKTFVEPTSEALTLPETLPVFVTDVKVTNAMSPITALEEFWSFGASTKEITLDFARSVSTPDVILQPFAPAVMITEAPAITETMSSPKTFVEPTSEALTSAETLPVLVTDAKITTAMDTITTSVDFWPFEASTKGITLDCAPSVSKPDVILQPFTPGVMVTESPAITETMSSTKTFDEPTSEALTSAETLLDLVTDGKITTAMDTITTSVDFWPFAASTKGITLDCAPSVSTPNIILQPVTPAVMVTEAPAITETMSSPKIFDEPTSEALTSADNLPDLVTDGKITTAMDTITTSEDFWPFAASTKGIALDCAPSVSTPDVILQPFTPTVTVTEATAITETMSSPKTFLEPTSEALTSAETLPVFLAQHQFHWKHTRLLEEPPQLKLHLLPQMVVVQLKKYHLQPLL